MPHGALFQARQLTGLVRYLPRWQQNLLAAGFLAAGGVLLALGDVAGVALLALVGLFAITKVRHHPRKRPTGAGTPEQDAGAGRNARLDLCGATEPAPGAGSRSTEGSNAAD